MMRSPPIIAALAGLLAVSTAALAQQAENPAETRNLFESAGEKQTS